MMVSLRKSMWGRDPDCARRAAIGDGERDAATSRRYAPIHVAARGPTATQLTITASIQVDDLATVPREYFEMIRPGRQRDGRTPESAVHERIVICDL